MAILWAWLVVFFTQLNSGILQRLLNFKLEHVGTCQGLKTLVNIDKNPKFAIINNVIFMEGSGNVTQEITGSLEIHLKVAKCHPDGRCEEPGLTVVPNCCLYLGKMPFQRSGMGDSFKPPIRCPVKRGHYSANVSYSLESFRALPIEAKYAWQVRLMPYEVRGKEKRLIICIEGTVRIQAFGSRKG